MGRLGKTMDRQDIAIDINVIGQDIACSKRSVFRCGESIIDCYRRIIDCCYIECHGCGYVAALSINYSVFKGFNTIVIKLGCVIESTIAIIGYRAMSGLGEPWDHHRVAINIEIIG